MQAKQELSWAAIGARLKANRFFLYWFIPLTFVCALSLTYSVPTYYVCSTSLSTEEMSAIADGRSFTLNHPENYDLGLGPLRYSITPDDYDEVVESTEFICKVLATPVKTEDNSFEGTYYEYLIRHYRKSWSEACKQWLTRGEAYQADAQLPELDAFHPKGVVATAIARAKKSISCSINHQTKLVTLSVKAQDPLVAALIAQATSKALDQFATDYYADKTEQIYQQLQAQIALTRAGYDEALRTGDNTRAAMLHDACASFERQAIVLQAQKLSNTKFTTLKNVTVPTDPAGPKHLATAIAVTMIVLVLTLLVIYRREVFSLL